MRYLWMMLMACAVMLMAVLLIGGQRERQLDWWIYCFGSGRGALSATNRMNAQPPTPWEQVRGLFWLLACHVRRMNSVYLFDIKRLFSLYTY